MTSRTITVSVDARLLVQVDRLVADGVFASRDHAIQIAIEDKLARIRRDRLAHECAKLDARDEQRASDADLSEDLADWPTY